MDGYSPDAIDRTAKWAAYFAATWGMISEAPTRTHSRSLGRDGTPAWGSAFMSWMTREERHAADRSDEDRLRTARVMRKLRRIAPRTYEVMYRILVSGESIEQVTAWLNARALANAIPLPAGRSEHYRPKDTYAILTCGVEYALHYW